MNKKRIILIISGGVAAYKALELIRLLCVDHHEVKCILTKGGAQFVTPLSIQALSGQEVYQDLFELTQSNAIEHISLTRDADMVVAYPASANLMVQMATGMATDLATALLLAAPSHLPILIAPAMNVQMWEHPATQHNYQLLKKRKVVFVGPDKGDMACGEYGYGRLVSPTDMYEKIKEHFSLSNALSGKKALVTAGPTHEPIDPVRFLGNLSSGRQGYAIAEALRDSGAEVTLVSGPVALDPLRGVTLVHVNTAQEMFKACQEALPVDIAVMTAAVSDWRIKTFSDKKIKKSGAAPAPLELITNPDILSWVSQEAPSRPSLVIGFAAETNDLLDNAEAKRKRKKCDWIIVNDVNSATEIMGGIENEVTVLSSSGKQHFERTSKKDVGLLLTQKIIHFFNLKHRG